MVFQIVVFVLLTLRCHAVLRLTWLPVLLLLPFPLFAQDDSHMEVLIGAVGGNTDATAGIYRATFDPEKGQLQDPELKFEMNGAGWVTQFRDTIYSTGSVDGAPSVVAYSQTEQLGSQPIGDGGSCFVTTDRTGSMLISAQYGGGSVAVFPINKDGSIGARKQLIEHQGGSKVVPKRQDSPHPHYISISPDNRFAFVPDLGLDQLVAYRIDADKQELVPHGVVDVEPGGGPRHMKFHPSGEFAFVLNELSLQVTLFAYNAKTGDMKKLQTVAALTKEEQAENDFNSASEIRVHPSGTMVISANRGHDSLSVFRFDASAGKMERTQLVSARATWPRNFNLTPSGDYLLAAGRDSNTISIFKVDADSSSIRYVQRGTSFAPAPICVSVTK